MYAASFMYHGGNVYGDYYNYPKPHIQIYYYILYVMIIILTLNFIEDLFPVNCYVPQ